MVLFCSTSDEDSRLLVRSDLEDPLAARREVERWAVDHGIRISRMVLRLRVVDEDGSMREWTVLPRPASEEPPPSRPKKHQFATRANERRKESRTELPEFLKVLNNALFAA